MFQRTSILLSIVLVLLLSPPLLAGMLFHGQVVSSFGGQLEVDVGGETIHFIVADTAPITLDGVPVALNALTSDHVVTLSAEHEGVQWVTTKVEAESQKLP